MLARISCKHECVLHNHLELDARCPMLDQSNYLAGVVERISFFERVMRVN